MKIKTFEKWLIVLLFISAPVVAWKYASSQVQPSPAKIYFDYLDEAYDYQKPV